MDVDFVRSESGVAAGQADSEKGTLPASCPMAALLETLARPWTMHILWQLNTSGPMRFGALRRKVEGISARLLALRLRTLEAEGFVRRRAMGGKVPEVIYSPTSRLTDMHEVLAQLQRVSAKWQREDSADV